jgi:cyclophilin family peptidyl-prolyl cis-trans isomerase
MNYTVFGEVISGFDIIDKIASALKDDNDRPLQNIRMKIIMLK